MPRAGPSTPNKPSHLRTTFAKPPKSKVSIRQAPPVPGPPKVRTAKVGYEVEQNGSPDEVIDKASRRDGESEGSQAGSAGQPPEQTFYPGPPSVGDRSRRKRPRVHPQKSISKLWKNFNPDYLGRVTRILPETAAASALAGSRRQKSQNAAESYDEAKRACEDTVNKIIDECRAMNQKYTDVHFDLEADLKITGKRDCIDGLVQTPENRHDPSDVKRVTDLFENPRFFADGVGFDDMIQGAIGDCWLMSAFSVLSCSEDLIRRVCVIQDQDVGVYGFVFFRDGEWHPTIIDDKLYLRALAFDESISTTLQAWGKEQETKYTELFQRGSKALYFASCRDDNETWVPLLEKALAKAHGGYDALGGGQTGEAIEDLTGGVTTEIYATNILSKEKFWKDELRRIGTDFMFDATDAMYREWKFRDADQPWVQTIRNERRKGLQARHAYAVLETYEGHGEKLIKIRNPWGQSEWGGAWSDGSPQWTAQWLERLDHKFGDDGVFWISYSDFLKNYKHINRTRIFDKSWYTTQKWASLQVPFSTIDYQRTKFQIDVPEVTETVIVLSQLDMRYFSGLEGKYRFHLHFRISRSDNENEYIARSRADYELLRSTNLELTLEKGSYTVLLKVEAVDLGKWGHQTPEEVIKANLPQRKDKVTTIGRLYDLAHSKGLQEDDEDEDQDETTTNASIPLEKTASEVAFLEMQSPAPPEESTSSESDFGSESETDSESDTSSYIDVQPRPGRRAPWNASCVVGLRVYSKQPDLSVKVIWPAKKWNKRKDTLPQLDRDAITKAPQDEAEKNATPVEQRKTAKFKPITAQEFDQLVGVVRRQSEAAAQNGDGQSDGGEENDGNEEAVD